MATEFGQSESKQSFYHLDICCRYIGEKYGRPVISEWTNGDYVKLSGVLSRQTDVQISSNTLKRIFGKLKTNERYYPQKATRDSLARYAGYLDWGDFQQKHSLFKSADIEPEKIPANIPPMKIEEEQVVATPKKKLLLLLPLITIALILIWIKFSSNTTVFPVVKGAQLICDNPDGTNPHSAIFRLKLSPDFQGSPENFILDFGDGKRPWKISPSTIVTHYYEIPGRYFPVLKYNNTALDTVYVYLKTNDWTATANSPSDTTRVYPLPTNSLFKNRNMRVTTGELFHAGVDTNHTFFVQFVNAKPMDISGDCFELNVQLTTSPDRPGVRCSQVNTTIYGENSRHFFTVMKPGCASWAHLQISEDFKDGNITDLDFLSADLSRGGNIQLTVIDKQATLTINGKVVHRSSYKMPLGEIHGIGILFSGIGEVDQVLLRDLKTGKVFKDQFNKINRVP